METVKEFVKMILIVKKDTHVSGVNVYLGDVYLIASVIQNVV